MDLWDLTKLLFRRWYIAVPMLLVSMTAVLLITHSVKPDYKATGHLLLIPPSGSVTDGQNDGKASAKIRNPWEDLGFQALGEAAILRAGDQQVLEGLVEAGYSSNVSMKLAYPTPMISIEVVGTTPAQATGTVQEVMRTLDQYVTTSQEQFKVARVDSITTLALDHGESVTIVTSKVKRMLVVTAGVGLLSTAASTIGLDTLIRRRRARRSAARGAEPETPATQRPTLPKPGTALTPPGSPVIATPARLAVKEGVTTPPDDARPGTQYRSASALGLDEQATAPKSTPRSNGAGHPGVSIEFRYDGAAEREPAPAAEPEPDPDEFEDRVDAVDPSMVPSDATIILPLSLAQWADGENKSKRR